MSKELGFDPEAMGLAFSVFGISYVIMQIPGGWLLDKYGSRLVYGCALIGWSIVTMFQGTIYLFASPLIVLVILRLMMGAIEAPPSPLTAVSAYSGFPIKSVDSSPRSIRPRSIFPGNYYAANDDYSA